MFRRLYGVCGSEFELDLQLQYFDTLGFPIQGSVLKISCPQMVLRPHFRLFPQISVAFGPRISYIHVLSKLELPSQLLFM